MANRVGMVVDLHQIAGGVQIRHQFFAALVAVEPGIGRAGIRRHRPVVADHPERRQIVPLPHLEVVRIMGRRHFHRAGAERRVHILVGNNRQHPADQRQHQIFADHVGITFISRIHRHPGIAEDRFRSGRRHRHILVRVVLHRIAHMVQLACRIFVLDLDVRQRRVAAGAPVGDSVALIDQALFI